VVVEGHRLKSRKTYYLNGLSNPVRYAVYEDDILALEKAIKERVYYVKINGQFVSPPRPLPGIINIRLEETRRHFKRLAKWNTPLTEQDFLARYQPPKLTTYKNAFESLRVKPIQVSDSYIASFVKAEKMIFGDHRKQDVKTPVPRLIQPRSPRHNVSIGVYISKIEKQVYAHINELFEAKTIFKGLNAEQRGKHLSGHWESFNKPCAIGLDASRFDQHFSLDMTRYTHEIYRYYYPGDKKLRSLLKCQETIKAFARTCNGKAMYTTQNCKASGEMDTSLGNCLAMSSMVHAYAKNRRVRIRLANDGDDCVVILDQHDKDKFTLGLTEWFHEMGFTMKVEDPVYNLEQIVFCQSQPIWTPQGYIMVRDPRTAISKDCLSLKPLDNPKTARRWFAAVSIGGLSLTGGIPIWQEFYNTLARSAGDAIPLTDPTLDTGLARLARNMTRRYQDIHDKTRCSYWIAFGIDPSEQVVAEEHYRRICFHPTPDVVRPVYGDQLYF